MQSTLYKDKWDTKEGCGKAMKNALHVQRYGKKHLSGWSNVEQQKIKPVALPIFELHKSEGIRQVGRQLVSQSVENSIKLFYFKFCSNFLKAFRINLKAFLGLVLPN